MTAEHPNVLLVDDDKHLLQTLGDYLAFEGFHVVQASSGENALRELRKQEPDIIVLDIGMPGMGGVGFFKEIEGPDGKPRYPVLFLTARAAMRDFFDGMNADGFLTKPCSGAELARTIHEVLERRVAAKVPGPVGRTLARVLLVENADDEAERIRSVFTGAGYTVDIAKRSLDIFRMAANLHPDVLLMKEMMPEMRGSALAAMAKGHPATEKIPSVLFDPSHYLEGRTRKGDKLPSHADVVILNDNPDALLEAVRGLLGG
jgi:DNA-binding response OmpR family regulator